MIYREVDINLGHSITNYLASLSERFTIVSDTEVVVDGKFHLQCEWSGGTLRHTIIQDENLIFTGVSQCDFVSNPVAHLLVLISDNFIHIRTNRNGYNDRYVSMLFITNEDFHYAGGVQATPPDLYAMVLNCYENPGLGYTLARLLNFTAPAGSTAFLDKAVLSNNGDTAFWFDDLCSCSTVPFNSTVTILGNNYLAIGTNTLVPLPEEFES